MEHMETAKSEAEQLAEDKTRYLAKTHTKNLLGMLKGARACGGWYSPCGDGDSKFGFTITELKGELTKREHVPNKAEARAIRQRKAQRKN